MKTTFARIAPYIMVLGILSLVSGQATAAPAQSPLQASDRQGSVYSQSANNGRLQADITINSRSAVIRNEWKSLPAPYNRSVAELNDILSYDTSQGTKALARKIREQEPAPFNRSVYELNP